METRPDDRSERKGPEATPGRGPASEATAMPGPTGHAQSTELVGDPGAEDPQADIDGGAAAGAVLGTVVAGPIGLAAGAAIGAAAGGIAGADDPRPSPVDGAPAPEAAGHQPGSARPRPDPGIPVVDALEEARRTGQGDPQSGT